MSKLIIIIFGLIGLILIIIPSFLFVIMLWKTNMWVAMFAIGAIIIIIAGQLLNDVD